MSMIPKNSERRRKQHGQKHKRPDWDYTVNDLSEFRATPEEIARRQESHRSKNLELVRKSAIEKRLATARRQALSDSTNAPNTGNAFLREILYSNGEASRLLDDTSKALQVAQDVFRDDSRKYKAVPAITAISSDDEENAVYRRPAAPDGLIMAASQPQTRLEKLSDSVMKKKALNETFSADSSDEEVRVQPDSRDYETTPASACPTRLDLQRFKNLLDQEDISTIASEASAPVVTENVARPAQPDVQPNSRHRYIERNEAYLPKDITEQKTPDSSHGEENARVPLRQEGVPPLQGTTDLQSLLDSLLAEMERYAADHGCQSEARNSNNSYTVSLLLSLIGMIGYFRQLQEKISEEKWARMAAEKRLDDLTRQTEQQMEDLVMTKAQLNEALDTLSTMKSEHRAELDALKETVARISKGQVVHTVPVSRPQSAAIGDPLAKAGPAMVPRKTGAGAVVTPFSERMESVASTKPYIHGQTDAVKEPVTPGASDATVGARTELLRLQVENDDLRNRFEKFELDLRNLTQQS